jgi:hypothetical protein
VTCTASDAEVADPPGLDDAVGDEPPPHAASKPAANTDASHELELGFIGDSPGWPNDCLVGYRRAVVVMLLAASASLRKRAPDAFRHSH